LAWVLSLGFTGDGVPNGHTAVAFHSRAPQSPTDSRAAHIPTDQAATLEGATMKGTEEQTLLIVDAVTDALKEPLPAMISREVSKQLDNQKSRAPPTAKELREMGLRGRQALMERGINPDTFRNMVIRDRSSKAAVAVKQQAARGRSIGSSADRMSASSEVTR
jgi:hypothetical protein